MKLRTKIQVFSIVFMLIMLLIVNTAIFFLFYNNATNTQLEQLAMQTDTLVERLAENENPAEAGELINAFLPTNGMAKVFPETGQPLEFLFRENAFDRLEGAYSTAEKQEIIRPENGVIVAVVTKPMIWHDGEIVTLQVSNNLIELQDTLSTLFYVLILAALIMLIPTIIGSNILSRFLLNPIHQLTQAMRENIRERKWKKINLENRSKDELYEMEVTFNEMIDELKENFEKQEVFVSNASHELKTPIQIVKSYAQLMERRGKDNPELLVESIEAIDSEADRMKKLVEQLLLLAKHKEDIAFEKVEFIQLINHTLKTFTRAYNRDIVFHKNSEEIFVLGNEEQLEQIIYILIDNALKYSDDQVVVSLFTHQEEAIFSVKDAGPGISESDQARIFERFYRVDKARTRETGGTGLGLAIAHNIATHHQGEIMIESKLGEGSTFTLVLPVMK